MLLLPTVSSFYNEDVYSVPMYVGSKIVVWVTGSLLILCLNSQKRFGLNRVVLRLVKFMEVFVCLFSICFYYLMFGTMS